VVQLSAFAAGGAPAQATTEAARIQSRLVAFNELLEVNCALLVDRRAGLRGAEAFTASEAPGADAPAWHGHLYTDAAGERWQEINLQALSQQPQFLSIGA
jgi:twitching motility protein PilI